MNQSELLNFRNIHLKVEKNHRRLVRKSGYILAQLIRVAEMAKTQWFKPIKFINHALQLTTRARKSDP